MYCPPAFAEDRPEVMAGLIRAHPLGLLITNGPQGLLANPIPFDLTPDGTTLRAHLARPNPQLDDLRMGTPALVVFQGEQAYVTPGWYATKAETGKVVPTWNYLMVQVRGMPAVTDDADWLRGQVGALTTQMESGQPGPWAVEDAPDSYIRSMIRGIVGLQIPVDQMVGKWKAGQNKSPADRAGVKQALAGTHPELAAATGDV